MKEATEFRSFVLTYTFAPIAIVVVLVVVAVGEIEMMCVVVFGGKIVPPVIVKFVVADILCVQYPSHVEIKFTT